MRNVLPAVVIAMRCGYIAMGDFKQFASHATLVIP